MKNKNYIRIAKNAAKLQIRELRKINKVFNKDFISAVNLISNCKGKVIAAGIGKSGLIARKISATLSSVGISSFYLNPGEANHGDLGQIDKRDILLVFSYSGNTAEIINMLKYANRFNIKTIGVAAKKNSVLIKASDIKILLPHVIESDPTEMVPTTSTSISLLFGDCLAIALMHKLNFSKERFKLYHPGGNIGKTLMLAKDVMITGNKVPIVDHKKNIDYAIREMNRKKLGLVVVTKKNYICGILTDGDARRSIKEYSKNHRVEKFMTKNPLMISQETSASKALSIMNEKEVTSLLVFDKKRGSKKKLAKLKGIVHIHYLLQYGIK